MPTNPSQEQVAVDIALREWRAMSARLTPIIGQRGVGALLARSLHLMKPAFPCFGFARPIEKGTMDSLLTSLEQCLQTQSPEMARAANDALRRAFIDLLDSLIGSALTARLIHGVSAGRASDARPQESDDGR